MIVAQNTIAEANFPDHFAVTKVTLTTGLDKYSLALDVRGTQGGTVQDSRYMIDSRIGLVRAMAHTTGVDLAYPDANSARMEYVVTGSRMHIREMLDTFEHAGCFTDYNGHADPVAMMGIHAMYDILDMGARLGVTSRVPEDASLKLAC